MSYYICHEHKTAYETNSQAKGHQNFQHTDDKVDIDTMLEEEIPEGYTFKPVEQAWNRRKARRVQGETQTSSTPSARPTTSPPKGVQESGDPIADNLGQMLTAVGVSDNSVQQIIAGFMRIEQFRKDPNALAQWLDTHITQTPLKRYIPLAVNEVFQNTAQEPTPFYVQPQHTAAPHYITYPQQPQWHSPQTAAGQIQYQPYYPQEPSQEVVKLDQKMNGILAELQKDREERTRERFEQIQREKDQAVNDQFKRLEGLILQAAKGGENTESVSLRDELRGLKDTVADDRYREMSNKFDQLAQHLGGNTGRTTEDIAHDLGPIVLEKLDSFGKDVGKEIKNLREHAMPRAPQGSEEVPEPMSLRSPEEIAEMAEIENDILEEVEGYPDDADSYLAPHIVQIEDTTALGLVPADGDIDGNIDSNIDGHIDDENTQDNTQEELDDEVS